jgi:hypothetical protein
VIQFTVEKNLSGRNREENLKKEQHEHPGKAGGHCKDMGKWQGPHPRQRKNKGKTEIKDI